MHVPQGTSGANSPPPRPLPVLLIHHAYAAPLLRSATVALLRLAQQAWPWSAHHGSPLCIPAQYASAHEEFRKAMADAQRRIRQALAALPVVGAEAARGDAAVALLADPADAEVRPAQVEGHKAGSQHAKNAGSHTFERARPELGGGCSQLTCSNISPRLWYLGSRQQ